MRIHGIHDNADGKGTASACGWFRVIQPLQALRDLGGHQVTYENGRPADPRGCDIIVGQRFDQPEVLREWRRYRVHSRLVYEIDDNIWEIPRANWMAWRTYHKEMHRDAVETAAGVSDIVTVTTEPLAEVLRKFNPEVRVIPNFIPQKLLSWPRPERTDVVRIGWRGGASHALDVQSIAAPMRAVLRRNPQARLHIVGTDFRKTVGMPADFTNWIPVWPRHDEFYRAIAPFDLAVVPLYGLEFDQSKSNIPVLEYAALGIPSVASDMTPYRDFIVNGKTGYLVRSRQDWVKRVTELVNDHQAREEMGAAARERAAAWTIEGNWHRWQDVYRELA
jgi:glycosyltransferase involved in cell wall biosynthesis